MTPGARSPLTPPVTRWLAVPWPARDWVACQTKPRAPEDLSTDARHGANLRFHQSDGCQP